MTRGIYVRNYSNPLDLKTVQIYSSTSQLSTEGATWRKVKDLRMSKLLTPEDIAVTPDNVEIIATSYDHQSQRNSNFTPMMTGMGTPTFGGTVTFNHSGQASDNDQDNDRSS